MVLFGYGKQVDLCMAATAIDGLPAAHAAPDSAEDPATPIGSACADAHQRCLPIARWRLSRDLPARAGVVEPSDDDADLKLCLRRLHPGQDSICCAPFRRRNLPIDARACGRVSRARMGATHAAPGLSLYLAQLWSAMLGDPELATHPSASPLWPARGAL